MMQIRINPVNKLDKNKFLVELVKKKMFQEETIDKFICNRSELESQISILLKITENLQTDENI